MHAAGVVEVRWCTTWVPWVGELERLWQLPTLGLAWDGDPLDTWEAKVDAAVGVLADGRQLVWTDDDLDPADLPPDITDAQEAGRVLLIRPRPTRGLRPEHLYEIEAFARREG